MVVPSNLNDSTAVTVLFMMVSGGSAGGFLLKSTIISFEHIELQVVKTAPDSQLLKGIVHFEIKIWYLSAYPKGIQDVGVFFSSVDPILMFLGHTPDACAHSDHLDMVVYKR